VSCSSQHGPRVCSRDAVIRRAVSLATVEGLEGLSIGTLADSVVDD
jgi:hypothetical protein